MKYALAYLRGKYRLFWSQCPMCNSSAPEMDSCPVCRNYREWPRPNYVKVHWWRLYKEEIERERTVDKILKDAEQEKDKN